MRCATRDVTGGGRGEGRGWQRQWAAGQGEAHRFPRLRPDQDICEGRGWGEGRVILKVRPRVPEKGFRNSPLLEMLFYDESDNNTLALEA